MTLGATGYLGFVKETVPGTPESPVTTFIPTESFVCFKDPKNIDRSATQGTLGHLPPVPGAQVPFGKLEGELHATHSAPVFYILGGTMVDTEVVPATVWTHAMEIGATPMSFTALGDMVYAKHEQGGGFMSKVELEMTAGEAASLKAEWLAKVDDDASAEAPVVAWPTSKPLTFVGAKITLAGAESSVIDVASISIDNSAQAKLILKELATPGQIRRKDIPKITGKLAFIDYPTAEYQRFRDAGTCALELLFSGAVIGGGPNKQFMKFALPAIAYTGGFDEDCKTEEITCEAEWEACLDTATGKILTVTAQTGAATLLGC